MAVQEDQHVPLAERVNAQSLEPAFDLKVWLVVLSHPSRPCELESGAVGKEPLLSARRPSYPKKNTKCKSLTTGPERGRQRHQMAARRLADQENAASVDGVP